MIPSAITRTLVLPKLEPEQFFATEWSSPSDKAKFGNHLLRFIAEGYPRHLFTKVFYRRLSNCFGHIAHYSEHGFWDYYFMELSQQLAFLEDTIAYPCYGDPAFTFSDVERVIKARIVRTGVLDWQRREVTRHREMAERALLRKLQEKYGVAEKPKPDIPEVLVPTIQTDLFGS